MSDETTANREEDWTSGQDVFWRKWREFRAENPIDSSIHRAPWPEENTGILEVMNVPRQRYYEYLNNLYFSDRQIILEIGADTRAGWSSTIDSQRHVVVRCSWSLRDEHPDIWQIPLQELIVLLSTSRGAPLANAIDTIIMENTLDCLAEEVLQSLLQLAGQYGIRVVALKYRPIAASDLETMQLHEQQHFSPDRECPALLMAAKELLGVMRSVLPNATDRGVLYLYRPPIGSVVAVPYRLQDGTSGQKQITQLQREEEQGDGAVSLIAFGKSILEGSDSLVLRNKLGQLVFALLSLHNRPTSTYSVALPKEPRASQITLVQAWCLSLHRMASRVGVRSAVHLDTVGVPSSRHLLHTADGELIRPAEFVRQWTRRGYSTLQLQEMAYGTVGLKTFQRYPVHQHWMGDRAGMLFQVSRIEVSPVGNKTDGTKGSFSVRFEARLR